MLGVLNNRHSSQYLPSLLHLSTSQSHSNPSSPSADPSPQNLLRNHRNMVSINALPNETLQQILGFVQPEDLESFAQTSRHINLVSQPYLKPHRELIRKYNSLQLVDDDYEIPDLLREILLSPSIGRYVRSLGIGGSVDYVAYELFRTHRGPMKDWQYIFDLCHSLWGVLIKLNTRGRWPDLESSSLEESETSSVWVVNAGERLLPTLLIPLLPNLSNLSIIWSASTYHSLRFAEYVTPSGLSHLTSVRLTGFLIYLQDLNIFSAMPSLKLLEAGKTSLIGWDDERDLNHHRSNVTKLGLSSSTVHFGTLEKYLRSFPKLQAFHFSFAKIQHENDTGVLFNAASIRAALLSQTKLSLQELTLLCEDDQISRYENHLLSNMGSLQDFQSLVDVFIDWSMLCPKSSDPYAHLQHCLPATIRRLRIREDRIRKDRRRNSLQHEAMLAALRASKSGPLTELKYVQIVFPYHWSINRHFRTGKGVVEGCHDEQYWKDSFEQVGILLDLSWRGPSPCLPERR